jgi:hypothetical protein
MYARKTSAKASNWPQCLSNIQSHKEYQLIELTQNFRQSGGAKALSLVGYSNTQIQKMGRWKEAMFKEYIQEELHCFLEGMTKNMK